MGSKTDTYENAVLDHLLGTASIAMPSAVYSKLFTVIPSDSTGGTEVTNASSGYTSVITTFVTAGATTDGRAVNATAITFATLAVSLTVVGWGLTATPTNATGTLIYWATVTSTALNPGDQATFGAGNIVITED